MSMILQSRVDGEFKPHPEGIHPAVCVDVIDLGLIEIEFQGQRRMVNRLRLVFESEQQDEQGRHCIVTKTFTASLHPKAKLADFLGKWRGRPVLPGETIDLAKLVGANCTLVISHQQNIVGRTYASIDAVTRPTKRLTPSGDYDPEMARQRIAEWKAKEAGQQAQPIAPAPALAPAARPVNPVAAVHPQPAAPQAPAPKSPPPNPSPAPAQEFDPEVGF